jgi:hypothetical protein
LILDCGHLLARIKKCFLQRIVTEFVNRYQETPRRKPSLAKAIARPATSIVGAENELNYRSTFESQYSWPKPVERPINGGSIHSSLDKFQGFDLYGKFPVFERSIAKAMLKGQNAPSAIFVSSPTRSDSNMQRLQYRTQDMHPSCILNSVEKSPLKVSCMTKERSSPARFKAQLSETRDVKFHDYTRSGPLADLSSQVEKSPIRYSVFKASESSSKPLKYLLDDPSPPQDSDQEKHAHSVKSQNEAPKSPSNRAVVGSALRFPPDGHPSSMFEVPVCRNEKCEAAANTIASWTKQTGQSYSLMRSSVDRSSPADQTYGLRVECPGLRASRCVSRSEVYDGVSAGLPDTQKPIAAYVEQSARKYAVFSSQVERILPVRVSADPNVPLQHEIRRQHLLQSRIDAIRGRKQELGMSKKLKRILNIE